MELGNSVQLDRNIIKSPQDDRQYGYLQLSNQLKILFITDQSTEKAAAGLSVRVGYLSDPDNIPGLAHLCEHMLFLGTDKYPSENEYTEFLSHHGGSSNACTTTEYTTYFFDVASEHIKEALDRFAQFFLCPLFNADAKDREINAVNSENSKNLQVDAWRFGQVCHSVSRSGHPYRKFGTGNKETLETRPRELGIDVRDELLKFHLQHYSSNLMTLVILGKEPLEELASFAQQLFSDVPNRNISIPEFPEHPYSDEQLQVWIDYVPVKELRNLILEFPIPDLTELYSSDPNFYVAHLIGHEGVGSLLSFLKSEGWCNSLCAGPSHGAKGFMFFSISMGLTVQGEEQIEDIVTAVFQYIALIRESGPQEWIFQECAALNEIAFRFKDKPKPRSYVMSLTRALHEFKPHEVLSGGYLLSHFRPDLIELVLDKLQPQFIRIGVQSRIFEGKTNSVEPWYGSQYTLRRIDSSLIDMWNNVTHNKELCLPAVNEFIPTNFDLLPLDKERAPNLPTLTLDSGMLKVWYKQDDTFLVPKACVCFQISTIHAHKDPTSSSLTSLFVRLLKDDLNEFAYNAEISGVAYNISMSVHGIIVQISGFNHKESILLSKIMKKLTNFTVDHKRFEIHKELLTRQLRNFKAEQPHTHAMYYVSVLMDNCVWTKEELASALDVVTSEQLQIFLPELLSRVHIEALVHGNISQKECLEVMDIVETSLRSGAGAEALPTDEIVQHRQFELPDGSSYCYCVNNEVHSSCCIELYLQIGPEETQTNMLLELLAQVLKEPCFDTLRTKEQLGYIVASGVRRANGVQGIRFLIQSDKPAAFVEKRVESFLLKAKDILSSMTEEIFQRHKRALSLKRLEKPKKLTSENNKHWNEIVLQQYHFNRDEEEVKYLESVTKDDLLKFFKDNVVFDAPQRHKLIVHVVPISTDTSQTPNNSVEDEVDSPASKSDVVTEEVDFNVPSLLEPTLITDFVSFKSNLSVYPSVKPYITTSL